MKIAIIDCGTNTFNLLIRSQEENRTLFNTKIPVRLAEDADDELRISNAAMERAMAALKSHRETALEWQAEALYVVATAAVRTAPNGPDLVARAESELGIRINVITGDTEARLIYEGVQQGIEFKEAPTLIMDIGGGSTEFILLRDKKPVWQASFPIGSSVMLNRFRPADPIQKEEIDAIDDYLDEKLISLKEACGKEFPRVLIGSSGSFDTLAQMCADNFKTSRFEEDETSYTFSMHEYMQISKKMLESTFEERLNTPGMIPMRADMIVMACIEINFIIKRFGIRLLQQCNYALKEGLYYALENEAEQWQRSSL
tara:strand:- start:7201 stop:8145 length:945 start_codon:yes stop_codon:yes gene_type:complete